MNTHYDHQLLDSQIQKEWEHASVYATEQHSQKPLFSIDTPPPTVSGSLHIGHIFSYTQTDIIARYKRLGGYNVFYPFGFDDNGLATERFVEKKHKVSGLYMGRSEFVKLCLTESAGMAQEFASLWKRIGISADWRHTYSTISPRAQKISQASFIDLYNKGYVYQKEDPALFCTTCRTAVAQAELDSVDLPSQFNTIEFTATDGTPLLIATTRPELLPSCVALLYHPDDARYQHLAGTQAIVPVFGMHVPILADDLVQQDKGTGLVMCCTFGDKTDIMWYKKHHLPYRPCMTLEGKWLETTGILAGLKAHIAREKIIEVLKEQNLVKEQKSLVHAVSVHERCKKEIEFVVVKQWFLRILDHKEQFLQALDKVDWYPSFMKSRCIDWIKNLQWDWCLSRQRFYGIPFPAWHCQNCSAVLLAPETALPIDPQEKQFPGGSCPECKSTDIVGDTDVMDTWNTSSLTPYIDLSLFSNSEHNTFGKEKPNFLPMSMRPQAHDIIRTWAFYTIIKTLLHHDTIPWKQIVISGHVLSKDKDKISKSQGNNPTDPEQLIKQYPADAIRYWTASGHLGHDVAFSETQLKIGQKLITKLWNAFRFIKEHINDAPSKKPHDLGLLNTWILHQAHVTFTEYSKQLEANEFGPALAAVEHFFWNDFCDNYLELIKDQLFHPELYTPEAVAATKWTLSHVGLRILQLLAPYIPHSTDTLYGMFFKETMGIPSLHITQFKDVQLPVHVPETVASVATLLDVISAVRKLKTAQELSLKTPVHTLTITGVHASAHTLLTSLEQCIKGITFSTTLVLEAKAHGANKLEQQGNTWHATIDLTQLHTEPKA